MSCGIFSIFKNTKETSRNSDITTDSRPCSAVDIPASSSHSSIPGSITSSSLLSEMSPRTLPRFRRGAIFPMANSDSHQPQQQQQQPQRFRSSTYSRRDLDPSDMSLPAPSSIYSQQTNLPTAAPSVATQSRRARGGGEARSESDIRASQVSFFGDYSMAPPPAPKRTRFFAALRSRFAAVRRKCSVFGRRGRDGGSDVEDLVEENENGRESDADYDSGDHDDTAPARYRSVFDDADIQPPRLGMDVTPGSYDVLVAEAELARDGKAAANADAAATDESELSSESSESDSDSESESESESEREREREDDERRRMKETEQFLFGGAWNEFEKWNDHSFLTWR